MGADLRLVIFDVDGTLVDSQGDILAAMKVAFDAVDVPVPDRQVVLGVVGLSLDVIFPRLCPALSGAAHTTMVSAYKQAYMDLRAKAGVAQSSPLYDGALATLEALQSQPEVILGVATGKSRRGLDKLIDGHGLQGYFFTQQVADYHPSKPHPSMILQAMRDVGVEPDRTIMVGDTSFDMEMAAAAGVAGVGVSWGYHPKAALGDAWTVVDSFAQVQPVLDEIWGV
tara:strand:- start:4699 stop:5376 length:678 start_codon:yes stop_codon:yes gene_type:complete